MATREIVQFKDKETGDINELRDKALMRAEKSSTTSDATNNSVIPLEKENGEIIKIKAESLMKAFAGMINSNSKSTITTLFGALTSGNTTEFGAINMSNLASVFLGATLTIISPTVNGKSLVSVENNIEGIESQAYGLRFGCFTNKWTGSSGYSVFGNTAASGAEIVAYLTVSGNDLRYGSGPAFQLAFEHYTSSLYWRCRYAGAWLAWLKV